MSYNWYELCRDHFECECYSEYGEELIMEDGFITHVSTVEYASCSKILDNDENIPTYPHNCVHLQGMVDWHVTNARAKFLFEKEWAEEQKQKKKEKIWRILQYV